MRRRVRRLKKLLVWGPVYLALISLLLSLVLLILYCKQASDYKETKEELETVIMQQNELMEKLDAINSTASTQTVSAEENKVNYDGMAETSEESDKSAVSFETGREDWPKKVYLTFDDGPSSNTAKILDILKDHGVHANFFCVGTENKELREMYRRILDEGHVLGMHSYSHKYNEIYSSKQAFTNDLDKITQLIFDETGFTPKYYRFPAGSANDVSSVDVDTLIPVLEARGLKYFDWNVASGDATNPMLSKEKIIENSLSNIDKHEETMILFHDLGNKTSTVEALSTIIEALQEHRIPIALIDDTTPQIKQNKKQ